MRAVDAVSCQRIACIVVHARACRRIVCNAVTPGGSEACDTKGPSVKPTAASDVCVGSTSHAMFIERGD